MFMVENVNRLSPMSGFFPSAGQRDFPVTWKLLSDLLPRNSTRIK